MNSLYVGGFAVFTQIEDITWSFYRISDFTTRMDLNFEVFNLTCSRRQSPYRIMSIVAVCIARMYALHLKKKSLQQFDGMDYCRQFRGGK